MARSTRQAAATTKPTKDPTYEPKRVDDKPVFWAYSIVDRLTWPITVFFLAFIGGISVVWLRFGEARAIALMSFLQDNVFYAVVSLLAMATVAVLRKVPQLGRFEKRQAATQQEVEQARAVSEQVLQAVKAAPGAAPREPDPTTGEIAVLVKKIAADMGTINERLGRVENGANAAAQASLGTRDTVVGYGGVLREFATAVSAVTGQTPAQRPPEPPQSPPWTPGGTGSHPAGYRAPEADPGGYTDELDAVEDWSRRGGSHRALTSQQPAVPPADEHEDWQELDDEDDDGPGLDTSLKRGFREQMAAAEARERAAREAPPAAAPRGPAPIWPSTQPVTDDDLPPHIRAAKQRALEQMRRERAEYWSNPEEGPQ